MNKPGTILLTIPFPGFYESILSSEIDSEEEQLAEHLVEQGEAHGATVQEVCDAIYRVTSYDIAHRAIAKEYAEAFADWLQGESGIAYTLEFESMDSPREYNFTTDRCYMRMPLADFERMREATDNVTLAFTIRDHFTSRDGFISHYSNDCEDWWEKPLAEYDHNEARTVLDAYLKTLKVDEDIHFAVYERIVSNSEFANALYAAIDHDALKQRLKDTVATRIEKA